jgi:hypothetical protein
MILVELLAVLRENELTGDERGEDFGLNELSNLDQPRIIVFVSKAHDPWKPVCHVCLLLQYLNHYIVSK